MLEGKRPPGAKRHRLRLRGYFTGTWLAEKLAPTASRHTGHADYEVTAARTYLAPGLRGRGCGLAAI